MGVVREQVQNGRIFRNLEEVECAMAEFVERFDPRERSGPTDQCPERS
jgi:hypothetical protein